MSLESGSNDSWGPVPANESSIVERAGKFALPVLQRRRGDGEYVIGLLFDLLSRIDALTDHRRGPLGNPVNTCGARHHPTDRVTASNSCLTIGSRELLMDVLGFESKGLPCAKAISMEFPTRVTGVSLRRPARRSVAAEIDKSQLHPSKPGLTRRTVFQD